MNRTQRHLITTLNRALEALNDAASTGPSIALDGVFDAFGLMTDAEVIVVANADRLRNFPGVRDAIRDAQLNVRVLAHANAPGGRTYTKELIKKAIQLVKS